MAGKTSVFVDYSAPAVDAGFLNINQTEAKNLIESSGQTLSDATLNQEATSVASYAAQGSVFGIDSGAADAYVFTQISPFLKPFALKNGLGVKFRPGNANTGGSCQVNVCAFGLKDVKMPDGTTNPPASTFNTGADIEMRYDGTRFRLTGSSSFTQATAYTSPPQTLTSAAQTILSHGLAGIPQIVTVEIVCQTAELGYSIGDVLEMNPAINDSSDSTRARGFSIVKDATNITVGIGSQGDMIIIQKGTRSFGTINFSNWKFVINAIYL